MSRLSAHGPTFLGIGAQKSGTTWLYKMLAAHDEIGMFPGKEAHFWDKRWPSGVPVDVYVADFAAIRKPIRGEITPAYGVLPRSTIAALHSHFPDVRLVYMMRNPLERAWSQARMDLAIFLRNAGKLPHDGLSPWLTAHFRSQKSVDRGDYAACLQRWLGFFPKEQLKTFIFEEFFLDPRAGLRECCIHIGADPGFYEAIPEREFTTVVLPENELLALDRVPLPPRCPPEFGEMLTEIYAPKVRMLEDQLERDLSKVWRMT